LHGNKPGSSTFEANALQILHFGERGDGVVADVMGNGAGNGLAAASVGLTDEGKRYKGLEAR
jgi:hypothetical protein